MNKCSFFLLFLLILGSSEILCQVPGVSEKIVSIAHRGGITREIPENTLLAFRKSIEMGIDVIEIDLRAIKDGEIIIMHDETIDRTTTGAGKVADLSFGQIKKLDLGRGQRIPTLKELLRLVKNADVQLLLDIKVSDNLDNRSVIKFIESYGMRNNVILAVRALADLYEFHQINADLRTLGFIPGLDQLELFIKNGVNIIRLWPEWIISRPELIEAIHQKGIPVWTTTGNMDRKEIQILVDHGINGIMHDSPEFLVEFLKQPDCKLQYGNN